MSYIEYIVSPSRDSYNVEKKEMSRMLANVSKQYKGTTKRFTRYCFIHFWNRETIRVRDGFDFFNRVFRQIKICWQRRQQNWQQLTFPASPTQKRFAPGHTSHRARTTQTHKCLNDPPKTCYQQLCVTKRNVYRSANGYDANRYDATGYDATRYDANRYDALSQTPRPYCCSNRF